MKPSCNKCTTLHRLSKPKLSMVSPEFLLNYVQPDSTRKALRNYTSARASPTTKKELAVETVAFFFDLDDEVVDVIEEVELRTVVDLIYMSPDEISITS